MSYEYDDTPDPWWVLPLTLLIIFGALIFFALNASVKYVEEEGYEVSETGI